MIYIYTNCPDLCGQALPAFHFNFIILVQEPNSLVAWCELEKITSAEHELKLRANERHRPPTKETRQSQLQLRRPPPGDFGGP